MDITPHQIATPRSVLPLPQPQTARAYLSTISYKFPHSATILTLSTSNVSVSTSTTSLVSENEGTAINRTAWPSGPWTTFVPNSGWQPTKKR